MKLKPSKSLEAVKDSIKDFITKLDNYLLVSNMEGEWNMLVLLQVTSEKSNTSQKIVEKFSEELIDYRINEIDIKDVNILNMSLLLL
jgi:Lrp/AsnC family leucine-responsive transcriptional regulator